MANVSLGFASGKAKGATLAHECHGPDLGALHARAAGNVADVYTRALVERKAAIASASNAKERAYAEAYAAVLEAEIVSKRRIQRAYDAIVRGDVGEAIRIAHGESSR